MTGLKPKKLHLSFILLYLFIFFFSFFQYANDKPRGIHQWAQSDRLAIAERFVEGRNVTDPATLLIKTEDGKVGVEFSGYQYVIAQLIRAGINKTYLPFLYRITTYSLFFCSLFILVFSVLKSENILFKSAIFLGLFSSPVLLYYSYNFLPDILGLTLILICLYFLFRDFEKYFYLILLISGFSFFIKTSSGIYFIAFYAIYFLKYWNKWNIKLILGGLIFIAIAVSVGWYDYFLVNQRNQELNSYVFLSSSRPTESYAAFIEIFNTAKRFLGEYFNNSQWVLLAILLVLNIFNISKLKIRSKSLQLTILIVIGLFALILLFGVQFKDHDYYVISTFMPIILFLAIKSIAKFAEYVPPKTSLTLAILFAIFSFSQGSNRHFNRMSENVNINGSIEHYERNWLIDADNKIENIVPKSDLVYVVYVPEPNLSLIYLERKGATFNTEEMSREKSPFNWFLDLQKTKWVVCQDKKLKQLKEDQAIFLNNSTIVYSDKNFTLFKVNGY